MTRRTLLPLTFAPLTAQARRPNILILHSDDQRWDTLRAWGNREIETPNLDRLARRGVSFRNAYNQGGHQPAVCIASRAMLLSGKSLWRATSSNGLNDRLMPEFFREAGYEPFFSGKWHLGKASLERCFREGGHLHLGGMGPQINPSLASFSQAQAAPVSGRATAIFARDCEMFLRSRSKSQQPYFAYCAFTAPHDPREAGELQSKLYAGRELALPRPWLPAPVTDNGELKIRDEMVVPAPRSREQCRKELRDYYALISELDHHIGKILEAIDLETTIVVFASDNGLAMGAHGLMGKQSMYEHSLRIPWLMAGPGIRKQEERSPVYLYELYGRLARLAGLETPSFAEGAAVDRPLYFGYRNFQRAVRLGARKMIWSKNASGVAREQYDLARDPWEERNRWGSAEAWPEEEFLQEAARAKAYFDDPHPHPAA